MKRLLMHCCLMGKGLEYLQQLDFCDYQRCGQVSLVAVLRGGFPFLGNTGFVGHPKLRLKCPTKP